MTDLEFADLDQRQVLELAANIAAGIVGPRECGYVTHAHRAWLNDDGGTAPYERCARLPTTPIGRRNARRDLHLIEAAKLLLPVAPWTGCIRLHKEWQQFLTRGPWRMWAAAGGPPDGCSALRRELFFASKLNRSRSIGVRHLHRKLRQVFEMQCRSGPAMMASEPQRVGSFGNASEHGGETARILSSCGASSEVSKESR